MIGLTWQNDIILMLDYIVWLENGFIFLNYWLVTHLYKKVFLVRRHTFETLYIDFCTWVEVNDKNIGKMKNNQQQKNY